MRNNVLLSCGAVLFAISPACVSAGQTMQGHIPCGVYSDVDAKKIIPADHVTYCFGKPMKRDEAIERAKELNNSDKDK
jgi:hypothetical protein